MLEIGTLLWTDADHCDNIGQQHGRKIAKHCWMSSCQRTVHYGHAMAMTSSLQEKMGHKLHILGQHLSQLVASIPPCENEHLRLPSKGLVFSMHEACQRHVRIQLHAVLRNSAEKL